MKWYIVKKRIPCSHDIMRMQDRYLVTNQKTTYKFFDLDTAVSFWSQLVADIAVADIDLNIDDYEDKGNR